MVTATLERPATARSTAHHHAPRLHNPWFAPSEEGVTLHRYFDEQFVPRFIQEAMAQRLGATRAQAWYSADRFGHQDLPTLRLPMHQTFYVACCEVSCEFHAAAAHALPAFDPQRILNAGFVVRRRTSTGEVQRWMLREGQPLGWQGGSIAAQDPDDYRRYLKLKLVAAQYPEPSYSGEETHPLHALSVRSRPTETGSRQHTLLWGYVPLGGSYRNESAAPPSAAAVQALAQEVHWPFGLRDSRAWQPQDHRPALRGMAGLALYELLDLLLLRHRVFDSSDDDNSALRATLADIHFYPSLTPRPPHAFNPYDAPPAATRGESLLSWIDSSRDALLAWLSQISSGQASVGALPLPRQTGVDGAGAPLSSARGDDLYLTAAQAQTLRAQLLARGSRAMATADTGLAMPRYGPGSDERYFIVPFLRWRDECGCEQISWGAQHSIDFRVVSPFDPQASRPRAILLPGLDDLKRGAAKGVTLVAPKSLATLLRKIKPDMDLGTGGPGNPSGLCWNFSLSIPVVTIVAFILLMIVINLLNLIFFWLPWAFLALPRWCGKALSEER